MNIDKINAVLDVYVKQGKIMRNKGKFNGKEAGICILLQWAGITACFMNWELFALCVQMGALKISRMMDGESYNLRPNKLQMKEFMRLHQHEMCWVSIADCTSTAWKQLHKNWVITQTGEWTKKSRASHNLGWFAESQVLAHFGQEWKMNRNRRTKGVADMVLTDANGKRTHWELKDMVGSGFQIRPEKAQELGLDALCAEED